MQRLKIATFIIFPVLLMIVLLTGIANRPVSGANEFTVIGQAHSATTTAASPLRSAINYQGVAALNGVPLNGTRAVTFSFSLSSDCQPSFRPVVRQVTFVNGVFSAVVPIAVDDFLGSALWLKATTLDNQNPPVEVLFGCDEILPVPYAVTSLVALQALSLAPITSHVSVAMQPYVVDDSPVARNAESVQLPHEARLTRYTSTGQCYQADLVRVELASGNQQVLASHVNGGGIYSTTTVLSDIGVNNVDYVYAIHYYVYKYPAANWQYTPACLALYQQVKEGALRVPLHGVTIQYTTMHP